MYQDSVSAEPGSEPGRGGGHLRRGRAVPAELQTPDGAEIADATPPISSAMSSPGRCTPPPSASASGSRRPRRGRHRPRRQGPQPGPAEAAELKRLAEEDVTGIRSWAKTEIERIRTDADLQVNERRERLEQHLVAHATIIDGEVDRVSEAVEGYRNELDVFFVRLAIERDPSEIARLADTVPEPPDLEVIRAVARAEAVERLSRLEAAGDEPPRPAEVGEPVEASGGRRRGGGRDASPPKPSWSRSRWPLPRARATPSSPSPSSSR